MEKIKIGKKKKLYEIESIIPHSRTVLKIVFPEGGDITILLSVRRAAV